MTAIEEMEDAGMAELIAKVFADSTAHVQEDVPDVLGDLERLQEELKKD